MAKRLSTIERIQHTLLLRDPEQTTICVGSAAVALHMAEVGRKLKAAVNDVDALSSDGGIIKLLETSAQLPESRLEVSKMSPFSLTLHPTRIAGSFGILPFNAFPSIADERNTTSYSSVMESQDFSLVGALNTPTISLASMLEWMAQVGRQRDVERVAEVLPIATTEGLVTSEQAERIEELRQAAIAAAVARRAYYEGGSR